MQFPAYNEAKQHLLHAFNLCAPTAAIQRAMVDKVHELEATNAPYDLVIAWICQALHDGVTHDHWIGRD